VEGTFQFFDHTADMGVRVRAGTMPELFVTAVEGLYKAVGEIAAGRRLEPFALEITGDSSAVILRDALNEILFFLENRRRKVVGWSRVEFSPGGLEAHGSAAIVDDAKSMYDREVKAVTYHELGVRPVDGGFEATFILDI